MAEMILSFVVEEALTRVVSFITNEFVLAWNFKEDLKGLQESLTMIRAVLQDAEEQQTERLAVRLWLKKLKDVAYEAEDVFDELAYANLQRKVKMQNQLENEVITSCTSFSLLKGNYFVRNAANHVKMAHKVKKINESLDKIKSEAITFQLLVNSRDRFMPQIDLDRLTDSILDNPVVGREADVIKVVNLLTNSCDQEALTVIPIVGMGGLGKTALAKLVFQEVNARKLFDIRIWVCVSDHFSDHRILTEMLQTLNGNMVGMTNKDAILEQLANALERKKFLLVLDDVWEDVDKRWDSLKIRLSNISKSNGNAILVTTRSEEVASIVETSTQCRHTLDFLSDDECWSIIKERAYGNGGASITSDLEAIGKEIAEKCKGVPLAARVLGGTMGFKKDRKEWLSIRDNDVLDAALGNEGSSILPILRLSFDHLPLYLKPCFAYCSVFPKDFLIEKEQLLQLWMAEGLLDPSNEDNGDMHFQLLVQNSFFQDVERDELENIKACKMHDLVHDLALSLSNPETFTFKNYSAGDDASSIQRLYVDNQHATTSVACVISGAKKMRTLFINDAFFQESWKFKRLRTLKLKGMGIEELPSSIGKLKHLRYLDVSSTQIKELPESVTELYNLQTLKFLLCQSLTELPRNKICNLISLRHIGFSYYHQIPLRLGWLSCLETLPTFVVGSDYGGSIQELESLNKLKGTLVIENLEKVKDREEADKANLQGKMKIRALSFGWKEKRKMLACYNDKEVLEGLRPHSNIKSLEIRNYCGEGFPSWVLLMKVPGERDSFTVLNNLVNLKLHWCWDCSQLPRLGHLPRLKTLDIHGLPQVTAIDHNFYGIDDESPSSSTSSSSSSSRERRLFPALKVFSLSHMYFLDEWKIPTVCEEGDAVAAFPCLEEFSICGSPELTKFPISDRSSLVKLKLDGCNKMSYLFDELHSFPSLKSLMIGGCNNIISLSGVLQSCTFLEELIVRDCQSLVSVPENLGELSSLVSLEITDCRDLSSFPAGILCKLTQLKKLVIGRFSGMLDHFPYLNSIQDLPSLESLTIYGSETSFIGLRGELQLPNQLQHLNALKEMIIINFHGLEALPEWLGSLSSLRYLSIIDCWKLMYLPTSTAMQRLSKLSVLKIRACPFLMVTCAKGGLEWSKISHIPNVEIISDLRAEEA